MVGLDSQPPYAVRSAAQLPQSASTHESSPPLLSVAAVDGGPGGGPCEEIWQPRRGRRVRRGMVRRRWEVDKRVLHRERPSDPLEEVDWPPKRRGQGGSSARSCVAGEGRTLQGREVGPPRRSLLEVAVGARAALGARLVQVEGKAVLLHLGPLDEVPRALLPRPGGLGRLGGPVVLRGDEARLVGRGPLPALRPFGLVCLARPPVLLASAVVPAWALGLRGLRARHQARLLLHPLHLPELVEVVRGAHVTELAVLALRAAVGLPAVRAGPAEPFPMHRGAQGRERRRRLKGVVEADGLLGIGHVADRVPAALLPLVRLEVGAATDVAVGARRSLQAAAAAPAVGAGPAGPGAVIRGA
mmetsp:Transcript_68193/g.200257  ORF Transcript_68193/g.200257 Transcript_68193/m.200257 type:complete len:358 (-) Transcript_68193:699-1772(-)